MTEPRLLRREDPPPSRQAHRRSRRSKLDRVAAELRKHPGEWWVIYDGPYSGAAGAMATRIARGQVGCFTPTGDFDATSRSRDGVVIVYARYVGDPEGSDG